MSSLKQTGKRQSSDLGAHGVLRKESPRHPTQTFTWMPRTWEREKAGREEADPPIKGCPRLTEAKGPRGSVRGLERATGGTVED